MDIADNYDMQTIMVMERVLVENSNCIDIGAHAGTILSEMQRCSPNGVHYAFEPIPYLFEGLTKNYPYSKIYCLALSDKDGKSTFKHVINNPAYSGLKTRRYDSNDVIVEDITVDTKKLDDVYPNNLKVRLIKVDVEGGEYDVFKGAAKTITKNMPVIIFEFGIGAADYYNVTPDMMYELLVNECKLKISTMERWLSGLNPFNKEEFKEQFYKCIDYYFMAYPIWLVPRK